MVLFGFVIHFTKKVKNRLYKAVGCFRQNRLFAGSSDNYDKNFARDICIIRTIVLLQGTMTTLSSKTTILSSKTTKWWEIDDTQQHETKKLCNMMSFVLLHCQKLICVIFCYTQARTKPKPFCHPRDHLNVTHFCHPTRCVRHFLDVKYAAILPKLKSIKQEILINYNLLKEQIL